MRLAPAGKRTCLSSGARKARSVWVRIGCMRSTDPLCRAERKMRGLPCQEQEGARARGAHRHALNGVPAVGQACGTDVRAISEVILGTPRLAPPPRTARAGAKDRADNGTSSHDVERRGGRPRGSRQSSLNRAERKHHRERNRLATMSRFPQNRNVTLDSEPFRPLVDAYRKVHLDRNTCRTEQSELSTAHADLHTRRHCEFRDEQVETPNTPPVDARRMTTAERTVGAIIAHGTTRLRAAGTCTKRKRCRRVV